MEARTFGFHILRLDTHREFALWEKIVMLGLTLQKSPGVREKMLAALDRCSVRRRYETPTDIDKIAGLMVNKQQVRRDFLAFANTAATSLKAAPILYPDEHLCG